MVSVGKADTECRSGCTSTDLSHLICNWTRVWYSLLLFGCFIMGFSKLLWREKVKADEGQVGTPV